MQLNCPHCRDSIAVPDGDTASGVTCPSCGEQLQLDPEKTTIWKQPGRARLGEFELIEQVGRGAFGTVYRATDTKLDRIVAVKVPRSGTFGTAEDEDRFVREARSVAQLNHFGIVPVYAVGRAETFPYIVTEFVEGIALSDALTARRFGFREAAEVVMSVAEALAHAHQRGVVHRDLKPSNIILEPNGSGSSTTLAQLPCFV